MALYWCKTKILATSTPKNLENQTRVSHHFRIQASKRQPKPHPKSTKTTPQNHTPSSTKTTPQGYLKAWKGDRMRSEETRGEKKKTDYTTHHEEQERRGGRAITEYTRSTCKRGERENQTKRHRNSKTRRHRRRIDSTRGRLSALLHVSKKVLTKQWGPASFQVVHAEQRNGARVSALPRAWEMPPDPRNVKMPSNMICLHHCCMPRCLSCQGGNANAVKLR